MFRKLFGIIFLCIHNDSRCDVFVTGVDYYGIIVIDLLLPKHEYHQIYNIRCTLVGNYIIDHRYVVGASPVGAALATSSFST